MSPLSQSILLMLGSTFCISMGGLIGKLLTVQLAFEPLLWLRLFLPGAAMLLVAALIGKAFPNLKQWGSLLLRSLFIALTQVCFVLSLTQLSLIETAVLFSTSPLFIPVIERVMTGVKLSGVTVLALVVTMMGVVIQSGILEDIDFRPALLIGLGSGFFNACSQVVLYRASRISLNPLVINGGCFTGASLLVIPLLAWHMVTEQPTFLVDVVPVQIIVLLALMSLGTIGTQVFRTMAYRRVPSASLLAPLIYSNLVISAIFQGVFFDVEFAPHQLAGLGIVGATSLLYTLYKLARNRQH